MVTIEEFGFKAMPMFEVIAVQGQTYTKSTLDYKRLTYAARIIKRKL